MNLTLTPVPDVPEIRLELADAGAGLWDDSDGRDLHEQTPPYWAFAWAGGQGLARFLLENPHLVHGKRVLDLGSGSGIVAIAAARAGAAQVYAVDTDPAAVAAIRRNATANAVEVIATTGDLLGDLAHPLAGAAGSFPTGEPWAGIAPDPPAGVAGVAGIDVVMFGDMFYSPRTAHRIMRFLRRVRTADPMVRILVSDPNRGYLSPDRFDELAAYDVTVPEHVEQTSSMRVTIWQLRDFD